MAGHRKPWRDLSPDYRARLERAGVTAASHRKETTDLRGVRGHAPSPPPSAAPREATALGVEGRATDDSRASLEAWRRTEGPSWLPTDRSVLSNDTAAALSQLPPPDAWGDVSITAHGGEEPWQMEVSIPGGYPITVEIPGGADARDVLHLLTDPDWYDIDDLDAWDSWADHYDFEVGS